MALEKDGRAGRGRISRAAVSVVLVVALFMFTWMFWGAAVADNFRNERLTNSPNYQSEHGRWDLLQLPENMEINAIHSVMLSTGDVLLIAGSGNDAENFEAGTFETLVYEPSTGQTTMIHTPEDLFCGGHAQLPNGNVLVAGGTQGYEVLPEDLERAGGVLTLVNENPDKEFTISAGSEVRGGDSGNIYTTDNDVTIPAATKDPATFEVTPTERNVYIASVDDGEAGIWEDNDNYVVLSLDDQDREDLHGYAPKINMDKKEYQGFDLAYEFNPYTREYEQVDSMNYERWYPTLTTMSDGHILALSGLDGAGLILDGQNEVYDPSTKQWTERDDLNRFFPTYPAVFQTDQPGLMFSAGPSTGWGPHDQGRDPGFWDLSDNSFTTVEGLREPGILETGSSTWLGPVNEQRLIVVGGGGIGESAESTGRIDMIDLSENNPRFIPLEDLPQGTRYPNLVNLPTGDVFITNGSEDYRGRGGSDILKSYLLDSVDGTLKPLADPEVGRNYHSSALLLPNGQILVAGSDPLFADEDKSIPGSFDTRIEVFTPPYLFNDDGGPVRRPVVEEAPLSAALGETFDITVTEGSPIDHVRLVYPGAVTHVTDTNQRLVDLDFDDNGDGTLTVKVPTNRALVPEGHYMFVLVDSEGVPGEALWMEVSWSALDNEVEIQGQDPDQGQWPSPAGASIHYGHH